MAYDGSQTNSEYAASRFVFNGSKSEDSPTVSFTECNFPVEDVFSQSIVLKAQKTLKKRRTFQQIQPHPLKK